MGQNKSKPRTNRLTTDEVSEEEEENLSPGCKRKTGSSKCKRPSFFRRQSEEAKRKLEHQLYLAQENPEPIFDISDCEINEIPSNVFSLCKVLQKEVLLIHNNWLSSLRSEGTVTDLKTIRILDLHNNLLKSLPDEIGYLESLQVLNLEGNKLKKIPESLSNLKALQSLNLKANKLEDIPAAFSELSSLRILDISQNKITMLSKDFCHIRTLEMLHLDANQMTYPPADICSNGAEVIMKFLCSECGIEYLPPSKFVLNVLEQPRALPTSFSNNSIKLLQEDAKLMQTLENYSNIMDKKRQDRIHLERQIEEHQQEQAKLAITAMKEKDHLVQAMAEEQIKMDEELTALTQKKEKERMQLISYLQEFERITSKLLKNLMQMNEKARKTEEILDALEKERIEQEEWFVVRQEEIRNLRRKDVLAGMEHILKKREILENIRQKHEADRNDLAQQALKKESDAATRVLNMLSLRNTEQTELLKALIEQEQLQKEAFEVLQLHKDAKHCRIINQIALIENELAQLTAVELERRNLKMETEKNILTEKRHALTEMLIQLLDERQNREDELKKRLKEMEEQRLQGQTDYWLVQYQRLMDRKPHALIDQEKQLEISVVKILEQSNAADYIQVFARHRITIETLLQMAEDDLKQMGIHELGLRKSILQHIQEYRAKEVECKANIEEESPVHPVPSAPDQELTSVSKPFRRMASITARGINTECAICLDKQSDVIFLNCGHVCCCQNCAVPLDSCPLCRAAIVQKINLVL